jgi:predicted DNA-binding protein with PD1-like motif
MHNLLQSTFTLDQRSADYHIHMINALQSTLTLDQRSADYHLHVINALQITITHGQHLVNSSITHDQRFTINIYT